MHWRSVYLPIKITKISALATQMCDRNLLTLHLIQLRTLYFALFLSLPLHIPFCVRGVRAIVRTLSPMRALLILCFLTVQHVRCVEAASVAATVVVDIVVVKILYI